MARELQELVEHALGILRTRHGAYLERSADSVLIAGDTHGFPETSRWVLGLADELGVDLVVFLGDYVDRGPRGVENLELLLERLVSEPEHVVLLRGNHESPVMNYYYGFREELVNKLGPEAQDYIEELYMCLPFYMVLNNQIWLVHGGVPCRKCSNEPEEPPSLEEIAKQVKEVHCTRDAIDPAGIPMQLLWNDPRGDLEWFAPSIRGPGIYFYGREAWRRFLEANSLELIIRAHETVDAVALWRPDGSYEPGLRHGEKRSLEELRHSVITVFTSLYHGLGAGAIHVTREGMTVYRYTG